ncbi:hypothetical protein BHE74_00021134 [Ensete ventricosum]|nr:hypothetical protein BHE74_00021134 [Ensete ventricosum]RZS20015.1 hypothetical protein BHM03_00052487 [Ensete ventricosum]
MGSDAAAYDASVAAISRDIARKKRVQTNSRILFFLLLCLVLNSCHSIPITRLISFPFSIRPTVRNKDWMVTGRGAPVASSPPHVALSKKLDRTSKEEEEEHRVEVEPDGLSSHESEEGSPTHSSHMNGCANYSISSESSFGSSSRSFSNAEVEEDICEERGEEKEGIDDWEALADALPVAHDRIQPTLNPPASVPDSTATAVGTNKDCHEGFAKPDDKPLVPRAWRADDAFRPQSLPNLSKQWSFPVSRERHYAAATRWAHHGILSAPSTCPICCEDLDPTDTSFLPCNCGFRLCLFCHKRILEADGRCPGCRKHYDPVAGCEKRENLESCAALRLRDPSPAGNFFSRMGEGMRRLDDLLPLYSSESV